jgi:RNA polymerase sigma factor (sigma-70 family)
MPPQLDVTVAPESKAVVSRVDRDRALVEARRRREPSAADDLLATYGDRACRLATRLTGNPQDAEEVVQDAFWCVIRQIDTFRRESAFGSWLYRIVANAAYQKLRRRAVRRRELSLDEMLPAFDHRGKHVEPVPDWSASVDDPARQTELRAALRSRNCLRTTARWWCSATSRDWRIARSGMLSGSPSAASRRACTERACSCASGWNGIFRRREPRRCSEGVEMSRRKGHGHGLSISRSIVVVHGGWLQAAPNEPHGAIFRFVLPIEVRWRGRDRPARRRGVMVDVTDGKRADGERQPRQWTADSMDRVNLAIQGTNDLEQMMTDVLDATLSIFQCDRTWLVYPCDPETMSHTVKMQRTRPEFAFHSARATSCRWTRTRPLCFVP